MSSLVQILLFPDFLQMVGLYKDPNGENIFKSSSGAASHPTVNISKDSGLNENDDVTVTGLRRRVRELEVAMKEKDVS